MYRESFETPVAPVKDNVFARAADLLERYGWAQHKWGIHGAPQCILGALDSAGAPDGELWTRMKDVICATVGCTNVVDWNNAPGRTAAEVISVLRSLAEETSNV